MQHGDHGDEHRQVPQVQGHGGEVDSGGGRPDPRPAGQRVQRGSGRSCRSGQCKGVQGQDQARGCHVAEGLPGQAHHRGRVGPERDQHQVGGDCPGRDQGSSPTSQQAGVEQQAQLGGEGPGQDEVQQADGRGQAQPEAGDVHRHHAGEQDGRPEPRAAIIGPHRQRGQGTHHHVDADEPQQLGGQPEQRLGPSRGCQPRDHGAGWCHDEQVDPDRPEQPGDPAPEPRRVRVPPRSPRPGVDRTAGDEEQRHDLQRPGRPWCPGVDRQRVVHHRTVRTPPDQAHRRVTQDHDGQGSRAHEVQDAVAIRRRRRNGAGHGRWRREPHGPERTPGGQAQAPTGSASGEPSGGGLRGPCVR